MKKLLSLLFIFCSFAYAAPYAEKSQDELKQLFNIEQSGEAYNINVDLPGLIEITKNLESHALNYPVLFDNEADQKNAIRDVIYLTNIMDVIYPKFEKEIILLSLTLRLNNVAYNLGIQQDVSSARVLKAAEGIFLIEPNNIETNYRLGYFLAASGKSDVAKPYLEKAAEAGVINANYTLGLIALDEGNDQEAIKQLTIFKDKSENKDEVAKLIDAIEKGELKKDSAKTEDAKK